jgi:hypothetical protein
VETYNAMEQAADAFATRYRAAPDAALLNDAYEFGLVRCTSNVGTPVPILSDGQPLALP